jgi:hypothetical protein
MSRKYPKLQNIITHLEDAQALVDLLCVNGGPVPDDECKRLKNRKREWETDLKILRNIQHRLEGEPS